MTVESERPVGALSQDYTAMPSSEIALPIPQVDSRFGRVHRLLPVGRNHQPFRFGGHLKADSLA